MPENSTMPDGSNFPQGGFGGNFPQGGFGGQGDGEMPTMPEGGFNGGNRFNTEDMETTTVDLKDAHISVEIDGGKASGTMSDITVGSRLTITMEGDKAVRVVVSQNSFGGFGQGGFGGGNMPSFGGGSGSRPSGMGGSGRR